MCIQKVTFWLILPRKMDEFCNFCAFLKSTILTQKIMFEKQVFEQKLYNVSDLDIMILKRVRFQNKYFKTC